MSDTTRDNWPLAEVVRRHSVLRISIDLETSRTSMRIDPLHLTVTTVRGTIRRALPSTVSVSDDWAFASAVEELCAQLIFVGGGADGRKASEDLGHNDESARRPGSCNTPSSTDEGDA